MKKEKLSEIMKYNIYSGVLDLLSTLKQMNLKLAVVSGANRDFVTSIVKNNFDGLFDVVISGSDVKYGKPNPEPYLKAIDKLNVDSDSAIVIENAPLGIESAKSAKLKTFALTTTLGEDNLKNADKIFKSHAELQDFLIALIESK